MKERELLLIYIGLIALISFILTLIFFIHPDLSVIQIYYAPPLHKIFEGITSFIFFLIFLKAKNLYFKTGDKRMAIISAAFFTGTLLNIFHAITAKYSPFDLLSVKNLTEKPELFYLFIEKIIISSSFLICIFYSAKNYALKNKFIEKTFILYLFLLFASIIFHQAILPLFSIAQTKVYILIIDNFRIIDEILYFLAAFIFLAIKNPKNKKLFQILITGLFILGLGELVYANPIQTKFEGFVGHSSKIIGFYMILSGLRALEKTPEILSLKQKFTGYLSVLIILSYAIFTSLTLSVLGYSFPEYFNFLFYEFVLIFAVLQYIVASRIIRPLNNIIGIVDKYNPEENLATIPITSDDEVAILTEKINIISETNWTYLQNIKNKQEEEIFLRKIINNILTSETLENALYFICEEVGKLFEAERTKIRNYLKEENNFSEVITEYRINEKIPSSINQEKYPQEMGEYLANIFINKKEAYVNNETQSLDTFDYLKTYSQYSSTKSVIVAPVFYKDEIIAIIIIENITSLKSWDKEKIDLLLPICQQISLGINLFRLNEILKKALSNEKALREIFIKTREFEDHDNIFNYLINKILNLFNADSCLHIHWSDSKSYMYIKNEIYKNQKPAFTAKLDEISINNLDELIPSKPQDFVCINNVEKQISNKELKKYLLETKIQSFLSYPTERTKYYNQKELLGLTLVCFYTPKKWLPEEIEFYRLILDTVLIIYLEIKQREEKEEIKKTFVATLTHDLKSPILAEQRALEAIIPKTRNILSEIYQEALNDIYKTNENVLKLVNNLQSVYHYEAGRVILNKTETNIKILIENALVSLKYLAEEKKSFIIKEIPDDLPLINIDSDEISRVITNLVGNAIKHTKENTEIKINVSKNKNNILISVKDNGSGIAKDNIPSIFQRFPTEKRKVGSGLGLYLSKQIVEAHNGKIWFETQSEIGTTFYFSLPLQ